jgi:hypothetical protein
MHVLRIRHLVVVAAMAGSLAAAGCYVEPAGPGAVVVGAYGYDPLYYDGYMVFYDPVGRPYYNANGVRIWISPGSPHYARYTAHWRAHGPAYRRWYSAHGHRYHGHRLGHGYYGGHHGHRRGHAPARPHR